MMQIQQGGLSKFQNCLLVENPSPVRGILEKILPEGLQNLGGPRAGFFPDIPRYQGMDFDIIIQQGGF